MIFWVFVIVLIIGATAIKKYKEHEDSNNIEQKNGQNNEEETEKIKETDWTQCYQKTYLLTKNEYHEYKKLKHYADKNNLIICPKVRLLDIIVPREGYNNLAALGKISSKHIDFLICDQNLYVKGIIELDDNSHKQTERAERDKFVDSILTSVGYKVIHTYSITEDTISPFIEKKTEEEKSLG